jgi:hypothetical protein
MAWELIERQCGCGRHSQEWLSTPCVTVRKTYLTLNRKFQTSFSANKGTSAIVRWDDERKVVGIEIGPSENLPSGFTVRVCGGKTNMTSALVCCGNFCKRLAPWCGKSFKAVRKDGETIIEIALLPDNEIP